jgi:hypothetical protein
MMKKKAGCRVDMFHGWNACTSKKGYYFILVQSVPTFTFGSHLV